MLGVFVLLAVGWWLIRYRNAQHQQTAMKYSPAVRMRASIPESPYEEERKHLSRELHDSVGQILTAVGLQLRAIRLKPLSSDQLQIRLDEACRLNGEALRRVRDLAMGLRPPLLLEDEGLAPALEEHARQLFNHSGISTTVEVVGKLEDLSEDERLCIYRCVQEALTNCAKHARASSIRIAVRAQNNTVDVTVEDDGIGFEVEKHFGSGFGLLSMRERAAGVQGKISVVSRPGMGTAVCLRIPVSKGAPA